MNELLTAKEAAARLGIRPATLYSYVSRGKFRRVRGPDGRSRLYLAADVERLRVRSAARAGHAAVAEGALRWGEPVLDTSISRVGEGGIFYRHRTLSALLHEHLSFEDVCGLLWQHNGHGHVPIEDLAPWPPRAPHGDRFSLFALQHALLHAASTDPRPFTLPDRK